MTPTIKKDGYEFDFPIFDRRIKNIEQRILDIVQRGGLVTVEEKNGEYIFYEINKKISSSTIQYFL